MTERTMVSIQEIAGVKCQPLVDTAEKHRMTQINYAPEQRILTNATYSAQEDWGYAMSTQSIHEAIKLAIEIVRSSSDLNNAQSNLENF